MQWTHSVNPKWLEARKNYLTASEIMKLLPTTPTGRMRAGFEDALLKVWAYKQCKVTDDDVVSTGVMARGHILEPYAIQALNSSNLVAAQIYHWDDTLIHSADNIGVSPDALDVEQPKDCPVSLYECDARSVVEVKAYNAAVHYEAGLSANPGRLPERWQLATAMYVMPTIELGTLVFFNPSVTHPLFIHQFDRHDLEKELEMIADISTKYWSKIIDFEVNADAACDYNMINACPQEDHIIKELMDKEAVDGGCLNP